MQHFLCDEKLMKIFNKMKYFITNNINRKLSHWGYNEIDIPKKVGYPKIMDTRFLKGHFTWVSYYDSSSSAG